MGRVPGIIRNITDSFRERMAEGEVPINTIIRIKPSGAKPFLRIEGNSLTMERKNKETTQFSFDKVFTQESVNSEVYAHFKPLTGNISKCVNTTIFCYGQTGAGKTHTIVGTDTDVGIGLLLVRDCFRHTRSLSKLFQIVVSVSYIQIYNERIFDCLASGAECTLRQDRDSRIVVTGMSAEVVGDYEEFAKVFNRGRANRITGKTNLNEESSRSHSVLIVEFNLGAKACKFNIIDLAGSEDNRRTGNMGVRMTESSSINRSLFVLGNCVNAILKGSPRIPFRDSKLTRYLQDSMGGGSKCYLIANVVDSVDFAGDTYSTLCFASKSRQIVNTPEASVYTNSSNVSDQAQQAMARTISSKVLRCGVPQALSRVVQPSKVEMSPQTKTKSQSVFVNRAAESENRGNLKGALENLQTAYKIQGDSHIRVKIAELRKRSKRPQKQRVFKESELLDIINSGSFLHLKQLKGVGDKTAGAIIKHLQAGNVFGSMKDLEQVFKPTVVARIHNNLGESEEHL